MLRVDPRGERYRGSVGDLDGAAEVDTARSTEGPSPSMRVRGMYGSKRQRPLGNQSEVVRPVCVDRGFPIGHPVMSVAVMSRGESEMARPPCPSAQVGRAIDPLSPFERELGGF